MVAMILRPGKTPSGKEVRGLLRRLIKRIRRHWPDTRVRGKRRRLYLGFAGNTVLDRLVEPAADDIRVRRAQGQLAVLRGFAETRYAARSWARERRVVARIEASAGDHEDMLRRGGLDIRYVVSSLTKGHAEYIYATLYCARGQAENLIKQHKSERLS